MQGFFLTLYMDLTPQAPEGPGWYLQATGTGGQEPVRIIDPTYIAPEAAARLALSFDQGLGQHEGPSAHDIVGSGTSLIETALQDQLAYAEGQARRIATLRQRLAAIQDKNEE